ncbi:Protein of unknown function DUF1212 [Caldisalinibacter kiritimatiensis]|uniref:Threonine/serine exporter-like N-terminal domain-containing protein n=2 Tax=Caldisalinibacter kiritimatiensis TaxID=1304284 RepID=R1CPP7_9FIRM|nr:Protein of unknown function DUF1212 [Caldisalinibacter kiritimatiensis]
MNEALNLLEEIDNAGDYKSILKLFFGGIAGAFFCLMFGGSMLDFIATFFISSIVVLISAHLGKRNVTFFLSNVIGSIAATILAIIFSMTSLSFSIDKIIIGSIMPLVPGVAITNAIRDSISGDFLSGLSRSLEAIIIALAIAFGVGVTLKFQLIF